MKKRLAVGLALFASGPLLFLAAHRFGGFAEWYANNVFPFFKLTGGRFFGLFPFSVFEILLFSLAGLAVFFAARISVRLCRASGRERLRRDFKRKAAKAALALLYSVSVFTLVFMLTAGINYGRESFAYHVGIEARPSPVYELVALYLLLTDRALCLSQAVPVDERGVFALERGGLDARARSAMRALNARYGGLGDFFPQAKSPFSSRLVMSNFRIGGFFSPWTMEANFNGDMPGHTIPFVILHEHAHFAGHMREDEANFIAYLAGRHSPYVDLQYSAVYRGIMYALSALRGATGEEFFEELLELLPDQVRRDILARQEYWRQFDGRMAAVNERVNDAYLRLNRQDDGVLSYGRVVDLILAYYRGSLLHCGHLQAAREMLPVR